MVKQLPICLAASSASWTGGSREARGTEEHSMLGNGLNGRNSVMHGLHTEPRVSA